MNYRSLSDLSRAIRENTCKIPKDVDLIVGIPRSGMLIANMLALHLNRHVCDLSGYLNNVPLMHGQSRKVSHPNLVLPQEAKHILVMEDSVYSGKSIQDARELIEQNDPDRVVTYGAAYATPGGRNAVDIFFEVVPPPRLFEWNLMHRPFLEACCVDIDGVLCYDPLPEENDDGPAYRQFLLNAKPLAIPTYPVGHLVTSRLEKYRIETEAWLKKHDIAYKALHMLDLQDAATRQRLGNHAKFKASVYEKLDESLLFIESEASQAQEISARTGKPVLHFTEQTLYAPGLSYKLLKYESTSLLRRAIRKARRILHRTLAHG